MAKRKQSGIAGVEHSPMDPPPILNGIGRRVSRRQSLMVMNPDINPAVKDGQDTLRASPDSDTNYTAAVQPAEDSASPLSDAPSVEPPNKKRRVAREAAAKVKVEEPADGVAQVTTKKAAKKAQAAENDEALRGDPEADGADEEADPEEIKAASLRPPPVNSSYLPLPWKGRLGYACLCTYLRYSTPPVFSSRTTRIASILEHRHPLKDPSQPEHASKNRPDKEQPAEVRRGQEFIEQLCLANVRDMAKMIRWNDKYGIKFLRLSSESFPFASHPDYGYKLAPFAADALAEVGKVVAELGHRVTTHPGQFTQLGSPRAPVIENAIRDLEYHDEMLSLLKLPEQQDRDAVMVLHMGGVFGDKAATIARFRENYAKLSPSIKRRLVLENDDVCYSVHDLLPVCQELNIPLVLDFHHHNIVFDSDKIREGTKDIMDLYPQIKETWTRKGITQKMHYSEPTPSAITGMQRRKHNPRPATLPPCPNDMDLMIEAKDKEQAVFELMRTFKLPGWDTFNDIVPYTRFDDNKPVRAPKKKAAPKKGKQVKDEEDDDDDAATLDLEPSDAIQKVIPEDDVGMGGPENRVYWPPGMEEWLRPMKRVVKKKEPAETEAATIAWAKMTPVEKKAAKVAARAAAADERAALLSRGARKGDVNGNEGVAANRVAEEEAKTVAKSKPAIHKPASTKKTSVPKAPVKKAVSKKKKELTPLTSEDEDAKNEDMTDEKLEAKLAQADKELVAAKSRRGSGRAAKKARVSYAEHDDEVLADVG